MTETHPSETYANWIKKQDPTICCLQETHLIGKDYPQTEGEGIKKKSLTWIA